MSQMDASDGGASTIGAVVAPPFVKLPDPMELYRVRAARFRALAGASNLGPYLAFLGGLCELQHTCQIGLPPVDAPGAEEQGCAHDHAMPPLDRDRFTADAAFDETLARLIVGGAELAMPDTARAALARVAAMDGVGRAALACAVVTDAVPAEALAEHLFPAAAIQVHFSRLAAGLDPARLVRVGEGVCPVCGGPPVASLIVGWQGAQGARFCACAHCQTLWNEVRIKCVVCGSGEAITYQEVEGGAGHIKAENCGKCSCYVKIMHQHKNPALDPVADDVASLGLDLLMRETGARRAAFNPFLMGY